MSDTEFSQGSPETSTSSEAQAQEKPVKKVITVGNYTPKQSEGQAGEQRKGRKGRKDQSEPATKMNPALMRGPRPAKAKPPATTDPIEATEATEPAVDSDAAESATD